MDNFEQVLDAAPHMAALLGAAPHVKILATSREALRLRGEQEFPLGPLPIPDAKTASVLDFPSVQLFVQRARAAKPDFHLDEQDAARVAEICRRLDGLPLAIELAAARIRSFSPTDMLEQFDRRFQWLAVTGRDIPEWRRTLWSAINWSYNLLTEKERILFERLAVFAGGWTIEAAEAVCADEQVPRAEILNMLMQLVDKSLVIAEAGSRYRFLDTIGKFSREKLVERGELDGTSDRHLRYFADWADSLDAQFHIISPLVFQNRTGADLNNVRNALEWALHRSEVFEDGVRLSIPASLIFLEHGLIRDEFDSAQAFLRKTTDPLLKGRLLLRTASLASRIGQDDLVYEYARRAEKIARDMNERKLLADALQMIGDMDRNRGRFEIAHPSLTECMQIYRELDLPHQLNQSMTALANNYFYQGRRDVANSMMNEALEIAERIGDDAGKGYALLVRGGHLDEMGKYNESFATYQQALVLARAGGDHSSAAHCLNCLSIESNHLGDYPASAKYALESIALFQSLGQSEHAYTYRMLAYALLHQGLPTRAHAHALQSLKDNLNGGTGVLNCLTALAEIKLGQGNLEPVAKLYGYLSSRVKEKYAKVTPDSRSFDRIRPRWKGHRDLAGRRSIHDAGGGGSYRLSMDSDRGRPPETSSQPEANSNAKTEQALGLLRFDSIITASGRSPLDSTNWDHSARSRAHASSTTWQPATEPNGHTAKSVC
jgi:predicted ATPase